MSRCPKCTRMVDFLVSKPGEVACCMSCEVNAPVKPLEAFPYQQEHMANYNEQMEQLRKAIQEQMMIPPHILMEQSPIPAASWVRDKCSPRQMLDEVLRRPHSRFPEYESLFQRHSNYCQCDDCYSQRRRLIKELRDITCENR